jgi:hypothetical protein
MIIIVIVVVVVVVYIVYPVAIVFVVAGLGSCTGRYLALSDPDTRPLHSTSRTHASGVSTITMITWGLRTLGTPK